MIDFPTAPILHQTYVVGDRFWIWNGSGWARVRNQGQAVSVFVRLSGRPFVIDPGTLNVLGDPDITFTQLVPLLNAT